MSKPLTMHDALLVNVLGRALVDPITDEDLLADDIGSLVRVLPMVQRDSILIRDLAAAAEGMVEHYPLRRERAPAGGTNLWARACFDARVALAQVFRWRAGQAHDRLYPMEGAT